MSKELLMIGSERGAHSGIAAVVNVYFEQGLFRRWRGRYLATHTDGSRLAKASLAARSLAAFTARLAAGRVGLLHVLAASDASFWRKSAFVLAARACGVPYVIHVHCGRYAEFYHASRPWVRRLMRRQLEGARAVVALSEELRDALAAVAPRARVLGMPNPIPIPRWQATLWDAPPTVLFLGVLNQRKGFRDLLRAWPAVLQARPDARLVLAGSGELDVARALAGELGIAHSVELPGWVSDAAKEALLRRAWVLALPSYAEALPMAVLEAMAAGVPVVATRVGGLALAVDSSNGELVEPGDTAALAGALCALLGDAPRRLAAGAQARARAMQSFSAEALVPEIEALWREIAPQLEIRASPESLRTGSVVAAKAGTQGR